MRKLVLADSHNSVRQMLGFVLARQLEYEVVGEAACGIEAMRQCRESKPDVLITDLVLPHLSGVELVRTLRSEQPGLRVIIYTGSANRALAEAALKTRPHGFVHKFDVLEHLLTALREVCAGHSYYTGFATELTDTGARHEDLLEVLCPRERSVLQLIAEGETSRGIASTIGVSVKTVEYYRGSLMQKLRLRSIAALTRFAVQQGLLSIE